MFTSFFGAETLLANVFVANRIAMKDISFCALMLLLEHQDINVSNVRKCEQMISLLSFFATSIYSPDSNVRTQIKYLSFVLVCKNP